MGKLHSERYVFVDEGVPAKGFSDLGKLVDYLKIEGGFFSPESLEIREGFSLPISTSWDGEKKVYGVKRGDDLCSILEGPLDDGDFIELAKLISQNTAGN